MKKKAILRGAFGVPVGITIGYLVTIICSLGWGGGYYSPCVPELVELVGSEAVAVFVQMLFCAVIGGVFAGSSVIWEMEEWSIAKQTGVYFLITVLVMMPAAYLMHWMEHSAKGFISYFAIFAVLFVVIWLSQYISTRRSIRRINSRLQ